MVKSLRDMAFASHCHMVRAATHEKVSAAMLLLCASMQQPTHSLTLTLSSLACFFSLQSCGPEGYEALIHTRRGCFELAFLSV